MPAQQRRNGTVPVDVTVGPHLRATAASSMPVQCRKQDTPAQRGVAPHQRPATRANSCLIDLRSGRAERARGSCIVNTRARRFSAAAAGTIAAALVAAAGTAAAASMPPRSAPAPQATTGVGAGPTHVSSAPVLASPYTLRPGTKVPLTDVADIAFATPEVGYGLGASRRPQAVTYPLKTTNGGKTWTIDGPGLYFETADAPLAVSSIGVVNAQEAYIWGGPGGGGSTVVVTTDGGAQWRRASLGQATLAMSAAGGQLWTLASTARPSSPAPAVQLYVSSDGGRNWTLRSVIPDLRGWQADLDRTSATTAFALVSALKGSSPANDGIVETTNGGRSWVRRNDPCTTRRLGGDSEWTQRLAGTSAGALWLFCGGTPGTGLQPKSVERSANGAATWTAVSVQFADEGVHPEPAGAIPAIGYLSSPGASGLLATTSANDASLILGGNSVLLHSGDGGRNWSPLSAAIDAQFPKQLSVVGKQLVVLTVNALWRGSGTSWTLVAGTAKPY